MLNMWITILIFIYMPMCFQVSLYFFAKIKLNYFRTGQILLRLRWFVVFYYILLWNNRLTTIVERKLRKISSSLGLNFSIYCFLKRSQKYGSFIHTILNGDNADALNIYMRNYYYYFNSKLNFILNPWN